MDELKILAWQARARRDCDEATISRMKPEKFQQFSEILAVLDLKIVPREMKVFDEKTVEVLLYGHRKWMELVQGVDQLEND